MAEGRISSAGELICSRPLARAGDGFAPGQHEVRILDPGRDRDRWDLAAALSYVDGDGMACMVTVGRDRETQAWRALVLHRAGLRRTEPATAIVELDDAGRSALVAAARDATPWPYEPPSEETVRWRRAAERLVDRAMERSLAASQNTETEEGDDER